MDPALTAAVAAGKLTGATIRRLGRGGGTTLPGRVSARIDGRALEKLSRGLQRGVVLVAGTNGKTTTATLLRTILEAAGWRVVGNRAGANLVSGLTAAVVAVLRGRDFLTEPCDLESAFLLKTESVVDAHRWRSSACSKLTNSRTGAL